MVALNAEIERLNNILKIKMDDISSNEGKVRNLNGEIEQLRRKNSEYELRITQITQEWQMKVSSSESHLKQENEELRRRLNDQ